MDECKTHFKALNINVETTVVYTHEYPITFNIEVNCFGTKIKCHSSWPVLLSSDFVAECFYDYTQTFRCLSGSSSNRIKGSRCFIDQET